MKTRFAYITLSVIAALVLSSCDKNEMPRPNDFGEPNLIINLSTGSSPVTKATEDPASDKEKNIESVRIFLAKADANGEPDTKAPVLEIASNLFTMTDATINAKVFGTSGNYQLLYVLANCPSDLDIETKSYEEFIGSYKYVDKDVLDEFWTEDKFFMVNGVDMNTGSKDHNGGVFVDFSSTVNTSVTLERISAKIVADQDKYIDFSAKRQIVYGSDKDYVVSSAVIDSWALLNCVNSFNLIRKDTTELKQNNKVVLSPSTYTNYPVATIPKSYKSDGYYYTNPAVSGNTDGKPTYTELNFVPAGDSLYCLENNPEYYAVGYSKTSGKAGAPSVSDSKMKGRVTAVIFRAQLLLADGFDADINIDEPIGITPGTGQWKTKADTKIVKTIYAYKNRMYSDKTALTTANANLAGLDDAGLREKGVKIYDNGYMYYTYYLYKNDFTGTNVAPYYCVERNKCYRLTVTDVTSFGDDLPCDFTNYDPEDPVDKAVPRIKVSVDVAPWEKTATQNTEIMNY